MKVIIEWNYTCFGILITFDVLPWGYFIFVIDESWNYWNYFIISYNNVGTVWEVNETLSVDEKG